MSIFCWRSMHEYLCMYVCMVLYQEPINVMCVINYPIDNMTIFSDKNNNQLRFVFNTIFFCVKIVIYSKNFIYVSTFCGNVRFYIKLFVMIFESILLLPSWIELVIVSLYDWGRCSHLIVHILQQCTRL